MNFILFRIGYQWGLHMIIVDLGFQIDGDKKAVRYFPVYTLKQMKYSWSIESLGQAKLL